MLIDGKKLNLDEKIEDKEADSMSSMLEGLINGTMNIDDFDKHINSMVEDINQSGVLPPGIDPNDPENLRKNTESTVEDLESPKTNLGSEALLTNEIAATLLRGGMANLVVKAQPNAKFMELLEKAMKENPMLSLALLSGVTDALDETSAQLLKP